jgi:hypothetical protein
MIVLQLCGVIIATAAPASWCNSCSYLTLEHRAGGFGEGAALQYFPPAGIGSGRIGADRRLSRRSRCRSLGIWARDRPYRTISHGPRSHRFQPRPKGRGRASLTVYDAQSKRPALGGPLNVVLVLLFIQPAPARLSSSLGHRTHISGNRLEQNKYEYFGCLLWLMPAVRQCMPPSLSDELSQWTTHFSNNAK